YRVRVLRGERGLSQRALARAAGVGCQAVRRVEAGRGGALLATLWGIADGLGVYLADLVAEPGASRLDRPGAGRSAAEDGDVTVACEAGDSAVFSRRLEYHENVTVSVEGTAEVDPSVVACAPSLVVVRMPDAEADYFAHLIARTVRAADALGGVEGIG